MARKRSTRQRRGLLLGFLMLVVVACGAPSQSTTAATTGATVVSGKPANGTPVQVITTMSILADMIANVGGERVQVRNIIPVGAVVETYQPTPQDAQAVANASIVFYNGNGLESWISDLLASAAPGGQPQINLSEGLPALDVGGETYKNGNPHFWLSAAWGMRYVERIRDALVQLDPTGEGVYTQRAAAYNAQLQTLNAELKQMAARIPAAQRKLVTNHDAWPYFAQEYGFTLVGNILGNPEAEPSAGDLARLIQAIKAQNVKAIFSESQFNPKLLTALREDAGVAVIAQLYTDALGNSASGVATYIDLLRYDMKTIVDALQ